MEARFLLRCQWVGVGFVEVDDLQTPFAAQKAHVSVQIEEPGHLVPPSLTAEELRHTQEPHPKPLEVRLGHPHPIIDVAVVPFLKIFDQEFIPQ